MSAAVISTPSPTPAVALGGGVGVGVAVGTPGSSSILLHHHHHHRASPATSLSALPSASSPAGSSPGKSLRHVYFVEPAKIVTAPSTARRISQLRKLAKRKKAKRASVSISPTNPDPITPNQHSEDGTEDDKMQSSSHHHHPLSHQYNHGPQGHGPGKDVVRGPGGATTLSSLIGNTGSNNNGANFNHGGQGQGGEGQSSRSTLSPILNRSQPKDDPYGDNASVPSGPPTFSSLGGGQSPFSRPTPLQGYSSHNSLPPIPLNRGYSPENPATAASGTSGVNSSFPRPQQPFRSPTSNSDRSQISSARPINQSTGFALPPPNGLAGGGYTHGNGPSIPNSSGQNGSAVNGGGSGTGGSSASSGGGGGPASGGSGSGGGGGNTASPASNAKQPKVCDVCRKRKIRCVQQDTLAAEAERHLGKNPPCIGCKNLEVECTYLHVRRRPGRPNGFANPNRPTPSSRPGVSQQNSSNTINSSSSTVVPSRESYDSDAQSYSRRETTPSYAMQPPPPFPYTGDPPRPDVMTSYMRSPAQTSPNFYSGDHPHLPGISPQETDPAPPQRFNLVHFEPDLPPREPISTTSGSGGPSAAGGWSGPPAIMPTSSDKDTPSEHNPQSTSSGGRTRFQLYYSQLRLPDIQIEDVTSWSTLSFFTSLYLRHLHALLPLVHKPTFTLALAMRLDQKDVQFRAFLFSLIAYVICQSPMTRMIQAYSQSELERLQRDCHRASKLLQDRKYKAPSLIQVLTLILDYYYCAAVGKQSQAAALLGEAIQLAYIMRLNDDARMEAMNLDCCEIELRRRTFWHLYAIDTTEASGGMPLHLADHEGLPNFPLTIDDELITSQGNFPQPPGRTSYMIGFVILSQIFRILSDCLVRHRRYIRGSSLSDNPRDASNWIAAANQRLQAILDGLPPNLQASSPGTEANEEAAAVFGMQRANLIITAASVKFALYDFKTDLDPQAQGQEIAVEREVVSKDMYSMLASIPLDSLAANGESMRAKVLRIILALDKDPNKWSNTLRDWWDMFSMIQFVQMIPQSIDSVMPSRAPSPHD